MPKIQLTPKQVLEFIILGIKNENYQAAINLAQNYIDELDKLEEESQKDDQT
jgi:hypothetical protein